MKTIKNIAILVFLASISVACSDDNDNPVPINEEEVITTVRATLVPTGGGTTITLESEDLDGDGPDAPVLNISGNLAANTTYSGTLEILNETESPADNITLEILEEDEDHQFFYAFTNNIATATYNDQDGNGNPIGVAFDLVTNAAGTGNFIITLKHEPNKGAENVNTGDMTNAGGETDVQVTFNIVVQ